MSILENTGWPPEHHAEFPSGNIYIRQMVFPAAGKMIEGHKHRFDHTTYCAKGAIQIEVLSEESLPDRAGKYVESVHVIRASEGKNWFLVKAGVRHQLTALEDGTIGHCIYSHRNANGEVVQEYTGNIEATF